MWLLILCGMPLNVYFILFHLLYHDIPYLQNVAFFLTVVCNPLNFNDISQLSLCASTSQKKATLLYKLNLNGRHKIKRNSCMVHMYSIEERHTVYFIFGTGQE